MLNGVYKSVLEAFICFVVMSESVVKDDNADVEQQDVSADTAVAVEKDVEGSIKRRRGPEDCLNWESDEEEFTPFTQERIFTSVEKDQGRKVFAKKSVVKGVARKSASKRPRLKSHEVNAAGKIFYKYCLNIVKCNKTFK